MLSASLSLRSRPELLPCNATGVFHPPHAPYQLFLVVRYLLTLAGLADAGGGVRAPAEPGKSF